MRSGYKQTVFGLLRKHAELLAEIEEASALLSGRQSALDAIEAALRVFDPAIVPATENRRRGKNIVNGMHRFLLERMRQEGSVTTLGAAVALMADRGLDHRDRTLLTSMRKRCGDALHKMRRQGRVTGARYGKGGELEWQLSL